jgi:hypothetical protein
MDAVVAKITGASGKTEAVVFDVSAITVTVHSIDLSLLRKHLVVYLSRLAPARWLDPGCQPPVPSNLRVKSNFPSRIKPILPVQSPLKKYSDFPKAQITLSPQPSTPLEGRIAIVTDAGLDAMAASGASDESVLLADGEVVWS